MHRYIKIGIFVNLVLFVGYFLFAVFQKEQILKTGEFVLFELAPVDPRSLMQGDYMELAYALSEVTDVEFIPRKGKIYLTLDENRVASQFHFDPINVNDLAFDYRVKDGVLRFGADSFFFQEGQAEYFENAKFGGYLVNAKGESVLIGLYDEYFNKIGAPLEK
jgi:uncharacterized membrane-anchored protein